MSEISLLEKKLAEEPIKIPNNPFWDVFKRFSRDELIAMAINVTGTAVAEGLVDSQFLQTMTGPLSRRTKDIVLMTTGPVVEKAGFFPAHFKEAYDLYKEAPKEERDQLSTYFKGAVKNGTKSLIEDILIHDPLYVGLMFAGLKYLPETPAWALAAGSFAVAVVMVAGLEVGVTELFYKKYKNALKKSGFGKEDYYESRFLIRADKNPESVLERLSYEFGLEGHRDLEYYDRYFKNSLPSYSNRTPKLRLRNRRRNETEWFKTAQITYTRANELKEGTEQFRYFPQKKEKIYFYLDQDMPDSINAIKDDKVRRILSRAQDDGSYSDIHFTRSVAHNPELLVSTDQVYHIKERPYFVAELKVYKDTELLKEAMRYVMREFPVVQTTHGKLELSNFNGN